MTSTAASGSWAGALAYESYVGRWSRPVAEQFVEQLAVPPGRRWLDVGCGTGVLTGAVLDLAAPATVQGLDRSPQLVAHAGAHVGDPRASFRTGDAQDLPFDPGSFDAVVSGLVLNFLPDQPAAVSGMRRVSAVGGVVAAYVWDYAAGMEMIQRFWRAAARTDPAAAELDEGARFGVCAPGPLQDLFAGAGLDDVVTGVIEVPTVFTGFDDYWTPFLGGTGHAPAYVATLDDGARAALRDQLRADLPMRPDGTFALTARAWTVRGRVPGER